MPYPTTCSTTSDRDLSAEIVRVEAAMENIRVRTPWHRQHLGVLALQLWVLKGQEFERAQSAASLKAAA